METKHNNDLCVNIVHNNSVSDPDSDSYTDSDSMYSSDTSYISDLYDTNSVKTNCTSVSKIDDIDFTWVDEINDYSDFINDIPETVQIKSILINNENNVIWMNKDTIICDNGVISNPVIYSYICQKKNELKNNINQKIRINDIQIFHCTINETNIQPCLNRTDTCFDTAHFRQEQYNYINQNNIEFKPCISFFHNLNTILIIFSIHHSHNTLLPTKSKYNTRKHIKNRNRFTRRK